MVELSEKDLQQIVGGYQQEPKKDTTKTKPIKIIKVPDPQPHDSVYVEPLHPVQTFHVTPH